MDAEFRTTFIPKKPIVPQSGSSVAPVSKPVGIIFVVSLIIFILSLGMAGGAYAYKKYLTGEVSDLAVDLETVQKNLDPNSIKEFTVMDKRLKNAQTLLAGHNVVFPLFDVLRATTLPTVRYTKMDLGFGETGDLVATLSGESDGYRSIALQSQALSQNANLKNTIFSNFVVTPRGRVSFDVTFSIPRADLAFDKNIVTGAAVATNPTGDVSVDTVLPSTTVEESVDEVVEVGIDSTNSTNP